MYIIILEDDSYYCEFGLKNNVINARRFKNRKDAEKRALEKHLVNYRVISL